MLKVVTMIPHSFEIFKLSKILSKKIIFLFKRVSIIFEMKLR
jgi:hypothetical protein